MNTCTLLTTYLEEITIAKRKDVANLAGVSEATVSRVFNNVTHFGKKQSVKFLKLLMS
ncbi:LacI family DNA-binding transcriptional regulator [Halalkalibacter akibai]|uniref:LacI family DNA-binding transcriptional regulator n=1 Tax=Halalkalibacter akibai TaxID=1411 RepID=UPI0034E1B551